MKEIIEDLKDLSGVLGACLYQSQEGVIETNLPSIFTLEKLTELGRLLRKIHTAGGMSFHDLTDLSLHYDESVILVREVKENLIIFLLCDPGFNQNLISMSLNLAQQDLKDQQVTASTAAPQEPTPPAPAAPATPPPPAEDVLPVLAALKSHLPKIMGPMADIIFDETVETWQEQGNCTLGNLGSLVELLAEEIGSDDKVASFKEMIAPVLSQAGKG